MSKLNAAVQRLKSAVERKGLRWREPGISYEEQEIFWWRIDKALIVSIDDGQLCYLKVWGPHMTRDMEDGRVEDEHFLTMWQWLYPEVTP